MTKPTKCWFQCKSGKGKAHLGQSVTRWYWSAICGIALLFCDPCDDVPPVEKQCKRCRKRWLAEMERVTCAKGGVNQ